MSSQEAIERIVALLKEGKATQKAILEILQDYNEAVQEEIVGEIKARLGDDYAKLAAIGLAMGEVELSRRLYKNAKATARAVAKEIRAVQKADATLRELAMRLYEGYGFKDKEVLEPVRVLPKYLQKAIKKRDRKIMRPIEKLKTKPLKIAYRQLVENLESLSQEALKRHIETAYHEKIRYYARRIADTELHRARMSERAMEYLQDSNVELVKYTMSSAHPKTDICDFYAELDVGYGPGVVPKAQMRTLPLHPHCHCTYAPFYGKAKRRRPKPFDEAARATMARFDKRKKKEILGTYAMLARFESGESVEKIFNSVRPDYPIRRYVDVTGYNGGMEKYRDRIVRKFDNFPVKSKKDALKHFKTLWRDEESFERHLEKRMKEGTVEDAFDYLAKTVKCLSDAKTMTVARHENSWDRIHCASSNEWFVVFNEYGTIMTSHKRDETKKPFEQKHRMLGGEIEKGEVDEEFREFFKRLQNELGIF